MRIKEKQQDVLQNIEFAVSALYKSNPEMTDYAVLLIYEALVRLYEAEVAGRTVQSVDVSGVEADLLRNVRAVCEWRLGRQPMPVAEDEAPNAIRSTFPHWFSA
jgi:hypothetical protein